MDIDIFYEVQRLIQYGLDKELINSEDIIYTRNRILEVLKIDDFQEKEVEKERLDSPEPILKNILDWSFKNGIIENNSVVYRDLFDTKIMGCLMPRPSEVISKFNELYKSDKKSATQYFYNLSKNSNYIRTDRVKKNLKWKTNTEYGDIDITINLSKPEKDPKAIAAAKNMPSSSYPKCLLCKENEGYRGRLNHPARQNHRIIPINLNNEKWYFQYSPYVYYNEHCIILDSRHEAMKIGRETFVRLFDFVNKFPHYFLGSNADLPIVGGSILSHNHFQGGNYEFAMARADVEEQFELPQFKGVKFGILKWPMSVIRIEGEDREVLTDAAMCILNKWKTYSDEQADILCKTNGEEHNTVTAIARMKNSKFQMDLVLRNNRTTEEYPYGIFHPHSELHHIKKENIGLIEVMGLAVLPARLKDELHDLEYYLINREKLESMQEEELLKHKTWCKDILKKYDDINKDNVSSILKKEVGQCFLKVLLDAGVFKRDEKGNSAFKRFIAIL